MTRAFWMGAGVLGAVLSGSGMHDVASETPREARHATQAAAAVQFNPLASGLGSITAITAAGDSRVFLTLQAGSVVIWDGSQILPTPFLDVHAKISCCGERGLLSTSRSIRSTPGTVSSSWTTRT